MSDPVEKTPAQKKNKVRGSVLRLLDADFKILGKWITGSIFLLLNFLEKMFLSCCRFLGCNPGIFFLLLTFAFGVWGIPQRAHNFQVGYSELYLSFLGG
jgi:hypothetical protein